VQQKNFLEADPLWYKHAVIYQLHVRAFYDQNGDGIGDFAGLTEKLDYLESLGITAIWLLPFYPSPLKDDGYDISDYLDVNSTYGSLKDFRRFLRLTHERGIRVITELVINHTSDQHPWFQRARQAKPGSIWRDFYIWSDTPDRYKEARIIFKDFESSNWAWDPVANAYYWHRFYSHQPDLNFENPLVQKEVFRTLDFWFEMGVDGLRLDAVPYLFKQEGTNCENLEPTHAFIRKLRKHVDTHFTEKVLIAEANQWPEDAAAYFGQGDECHMAFHFPAMPRLFMGITMEDRFPIIDILEQTPPLPFTCQWAFFLRNHDELTLEMVSDEERDYMYRIYAKDPHARINLGIRRRLAPLLDNDRSKIELMKILLLSLPGTPVLYYGDELGMGDNFYLGDRNGVRTPMQWSADRNAGFSKANPQQLYLPLVIDPPYHYEMVNVENQESNPSSLLWWLRRVLSVYNSHPVFGFGTMEIINSPNSKILAFTRTYENEIILVITNISRFSQATELDLKKYVGHTPYELFHQNRFPIIKEEPYNITLGPHNYFWLSLKPSESLATTSKEEIPLLHVEKSWKNIFKDKSLQKLEYALPRFIKNARWFEHKAYTIHNTTIIAQMALDETQLCLVQVSYLEVEDIDIYLLLLSYAKKPKADQILQNTPQSFIAHLHIDGQEGILYDSIYDEDFKKNILQVILNRKRAKSLNDDQLIPSQGDSLRKGLFKEFTSSEPSQVSKSEQSNSSLVYGQQFFLKLYRRIEEGIHPDVEISQFLSDQAHFDHIPPYMGAIEWRHSRSQPLTIALLEKLVPNEGTGWTFFLDALTRYYEKVLALNESEKEHTKIHDLIGGSSLETARLLGQRTAEMHLALISKPEEPHFTPEPCSILDQRSIYQAMRGTVKTAVQLLRRKHVELPESLNGLIEDVVKSEHEVLNYFQKIIQKQFLCEKIRTHGDFHLGQVLYTGKDFFIIDFEGEPTQSLNARRIKRLSLRDVAGMIQSFFYVAHKALLSEVIKPEGMPTLEPWANVWYEQISVIYLQAYMQAIRKAPIPIVPKSDEDSAYLLQAFLFEKVFYELSYELNTRPDWVALACKGINYMLKNKIAV